MHSAIKKSYVTGSDRLPDVGVRVVNYSARAERIQLIEQLNRILDPIFNIKQFEFTPLEIRFDYPLYTTKNSI